jgi:DNA-binding CsgD family transcriptional regulator
VLGALSALFGDAAVDDRTAVEESAGVVARILADVVVVDVLAKGVWMIPIGARAADAERDGRLQAIVGESFRADHGFSACVLDSGESLLIPCVTQPELDAMHPEVGFIGEELGAQGFVIAPLYVRGVLAGLLWQIRTRAEPRLDEDDRRFLEEVAMRVSLAIERWQLTVALERVVLSHAAPGACTDGAVRMPVFTADERAVLEDVAHEREDAVIAARLGLGVRTVQGIRQQLQRRLGVSRRADLATLSRALGWWRMSDADAPPPPDGAHN